MWTSQININLSKGGRLQSDQYFIFGLFFIYFYFSTQVMLQGLLVDDYNVDSILKYASNNVNMLISEINCKLKIFLDTHGYMYPLEDIFISKFTKNLRKNFKFCITHAPEQILIKKAVGYSINSYTLGTKVKTFVTAGHVNKIQSLKQSQVNVKKESKTGKRKNNVIEVKNVQKCKIVR